MRLGHLTAWFRPWMPDSVFCAGGGRSSVEAWCSTALEIEEALVGGWRLPCHLFVAYGVKSFDAVDRGILDLALGRLGLPGWFRWVYFSYHAGVRLRFRLSCGLGQPRLLDGGIFQGCLSSMIFILALYLTWCRHLEAVPGISPQLYAHNLKCVSSGAQALWSAARFTNLFLAWLGRRLLLACAFSSVLLAKCVLRWPVG